MKSKILPILGHFLALGLLAWVIYPLARFYFSGFSAFGDYFAAYTIADYIKNYFTLPPASWIYSLNNGAPLFTFYQWFFFYLMQPLIMLFKSTAWGLEVYSFASLMAFYLFSYLLLYSLSKNHIFSVLLVVVLYYTLGVSEMLMRAGFITQNAVQPFLPLILWLVYLFYKKGSRRLLVLAGILAGLSLLGHVAIALFLIFVPVGLVIFFWWDEKIKLISPEKFKNALIYGTTALLVGFSAIIVGFGWQGASGKSTCETSTCIASYEGLKDYFNLWSLYILGAIIFLSFIWMIITRKNIFKKSIPYFFFLGFIFAYLVSTHFKLQITDAISTVLWPVRTIWAIALGMAALSAALLGEISGEGKWKKTVGWGFQIVISIVSLGLIFWMVILKPGDSLSLFESNRVGYEAFGPHIARFGIEKYQTGKYENYNASMVLPDWLEPNDQGYKIEQLWHGDFGAWPLISSVPQTRSALGNTSPRFMHWRAWLTATMTDQLGEKENRGKERQSNIHQSLFIIDWYGIRYINSSIDEVSKIMERDFPYAPYIESDWLTDRHEPRPIRHEGSKRASYLFDFWRIREEYTSPVIKASNAPTVFFVGDEQGWGNFVRALAISNTNSHELVPIEGPALLEKLTLPELKKFDMVFLYAYNYDNFNKAWATLTRYVEQGGTVFIDTGREVKESENKTLLSGVSEMPEILPSKVLTRLKLGQEWNLDVAQSSITQGVEFDQFSPLKFGDDEWTLSVVPEDKDLRGESEVILRQSGKPILVTRKVGQGKVIWSGINLPYYILNYQAVSEAKLLRQIISWATGGLEEQKPEFKVERPKPEEVKVSGADFKGVIFKENFDSGWKAKVNGRGEKIYLAGPDVMYVPAPKTAKNPLTVELNYRGTLFNWFLFIVSIISLIFSLLYITTGRLKFKIPKITNQFLKKWWEREEE